MAYTKRSDAELLQAALAGYQHQYDVLGQRIAEISRQLGGRPARLDMAGGDKPKRVMSPETRRRMAAAQQRRWAGVKGTGPSGAGKKKKRNMSAEGRERIAEATRKRWAEYRAQKAAQE